MKFTRLVVAVPALLVLLGFILILPHAVASNGSVETSSDDQVGMAITIYNDGTGLVKDTRDLELPGGRLDLIFMDVASSIDATSVHFVSNTDPDAITILEQNYEYDLVSTAKLYEKHIDKHVTVMTADERTVEGTLLAYDSGMVIQTDDGIIIVKNPVQVTFEDLPEGLITRPTLRWQLINDGSSSHECEMSYLTSGINWSANYVAVVNKDDDELDLTGWVTINNTSGTAYNDAILKLVAGEVNRVRPDYGYDARSSGNAPDFNLRSSSGFEEESFFEYHLYTLQRPATVQNNQQKQISLLEGEGIGVEKIFVFDPGYDYYSRGDTAEGEIEVRLQFMNSESNGLGIPIPKGILRVFKEDSSGALQFIGEDRVDHTPKDEQIEVFLGEAFDIVGERAVMDRRKINDRTWEYDVKITIRNHKEDDVEITYWDHVWGDWEVRESTHGYIQRDASTVEIMIPVDSDGETICEYTIRRGW